MLWGLVLDHLLSAHMFLIRKKVIKKIQKLLFSTYVKPTSPYSRTQQHTESKEVTISQHFQVYCLCHVFSGAPEHV